MIVALVWIASAMAAAEPDIPRRTVAMLHRGRTDMVFRYVQEQNKLNPGDQDVCVLEGAAHAVDREYVEAIALLERCQGSPFYEKSAIRYHADALRAMGEYEAAAALRTEQMMLKSISLDQEHYALINRILDYREAGEFQRALELADEAIGLAPDRPSFYGVKADIYLDQGDTGSARAELLIAEHMGFESRKPTLLAQARLQTALGEPDLAVSALNPLRKRFLQSPEFWDVYLRAKLAMGEVDETAEFLKLRRFLSIRSAELEALKAEVMFEQGDLKGAQVQILSAMETYPGSRVVQDAAMRMLSTATD